MDKDGFYRTPDGRIYGTPAQDQVLERIQYMLAIEFRDSIDQNTEYGVREETQTEWGLSEMTIALPKNGLWIKVQVDWIE